MKYILKHLGRKGHNILNLFLNDLENSFFSNIHVCVYMYIHKREQAHMIKQME